MSLKLYNSFSKKEEEFTPLKSGEVSMYTCGPTVYGRPHIGNYSSFLMADLLRRWLEVSGYKVTHVKNITDVGHLANDADEGEDKIEKQAKAEKIDPLAIARKYTAQYLADEKLLNLIEPEFRPLATGTVKEMITIIQELLKSGHAYETEDGIYFDVQTFPAYGKLSGNTLEHLNAGARIEVDEKKKHPADFALWKKTVGSNAHHILRWHFATGERSDSLGDDAQSGFPGWHIECSAMSRKHLGLTLDIHTGGEDNIFPHHECEIAQSECSGSHPFARYWLHKRRIEVIASEEASESQEGVKMSKSLGNVLSIDDVLGRGFSPMDLRYVLLSVHYRTRLKFNWKGMDDGKKARRKIMEWMTEMETHIANAGSKADVPVQKSSFIYADQFRAAMDADLNTSAALAAIFEAIAWTRNQTSLSSDELGAIRAFMKIIRATFGCFEPEEQASIPADVQKLFDDRQQARAHKNFALSDSLRKEIESRGFMVEDSAKGTRVVKK